MTAVVRYVGGKGGSGFGLSVNAADLPTRAEALRKLSEPVAAIPRAKRVPQDALLKALNNNPFENYPQAIYGYKHAFEEDHETISESYYQAVENFLRRTLRYHWRNILIFPLIYPTCIAIKR